MEGEEVPSFPHAGNKKEKTEHYLIGILRSLVRDELPKQLFKLLRGSFPGPTVEIVRV